MSVVRSLQMYFVSDTLCILSVFQLAARAADRDLADVKRENAHLRQKWDWLYMKCFLYMRSSIYSYIWMCLQLQADWCPI